MPTVHLNKKVLEKLVGKKLRLKKLKDRISYLGTDLDGIEGDQISVEIFPNRPDMLSEQGFGRALASFIGTKTGIKKYKVHKSGKQVIVKDLPKQWPYAVACIVKGLEFDDEKIREVIQLQEKLGTTLTRNRKKGGLGLYPLEKIKFPVTFTGKHPQDIFFRPLEFPNDLTANSILEKHPKGREYGHIIEGWKSYPVFIDANQKIMSMPPIINSHDVGKIDETTTDVFIECTGYDLNTIKISLNILATSLADMGGQIQSIEMVYPDEKYPIPDLEPEKMKLDVNYVNKVLGLDLTKKQCIKYLKQMGFGYENRVLIPAYRADILHQADLVEDIAIAYGYENFKEEIPNVATVGKEDDFEIFKRKISQSLVGFGLIETSTYHLTNKKDLVENTKYKTDFIELEKASSSEYNVLRTWLMPSLLQVLRANKHHEYPQNLFEIGIVFNKDKSTETKIKQTSKLAVVLCQKESYFTQAKQILDYLMKSIGLKYKTKIGKHPCFIEGRCAKVQVGKTKIGVIGELHPEVVSNFGLEVPAVGFEIDLKKLI
ncbi:MAG: Phenylalanine--tRNA ligase beta subunit [Candidatus Woesearchaeota archaeon]|nr:Phenylalanine--tRNA ligase beta subunit [Candidatus Woesearchaeota archaeon]